MAALFASTTPAAARWQDGGAWAQMSHARGVEIDRLVYVKCILYDGTTSGNYVCFYTSGSSDITAYSFHPPRR